jgi:DNA-directed RNA polymerase sigma subunit (sigma70/sigma32)
MVARTHTGNANVKTPANSNVKMSIESRIEEFATKHNIAPSKVRQLVGMLQQAAELDSAMDEIINTSPNTEEATEQQEETPATQEKSTKKNETSKRRVRSLSPETERIRKAILAIRPALKKPITAPELTEILGTELNTVNNSLRFFEADGIVKQAGKAKRGGRGKQPVLWQFS